MKAIAVLILILSIGAGNASGQRYSLYTDDSLVIESQYLGETIRLNLHLPETQPFSAKATRYPIMVVFDSQHERTYPQILHSIDLLTSETQIPESIIIGVPFNIRNRLYLTSSQVRKGDSLSGIERMELFLFSELLPKIKNQYKGNDFLSLIGHSRTGYLVNYLAFRRPSQVNVAVSLSGFFREKPLSIGGFHSFLTEPANFPHQFQYYYTAGTTREESTYLVQFRQLDSLLKSRPAPQQVKTSFRETSNANHITNFWVSVPPILVDAFAGYNSILDDWFHHKLGSENADVSVEQFSADLEHAGQEIGMQLNPSLTHIFSLASHFANSNQDYRTAIDFMELGLRYYPDMLDLYVEVIEFYKELEEPEKMAHYQRVLREKTTESTHLTDSEKEEMLQYLDAK